jgi:hypothetical protein
MFGCNKYNQIIFCTKKNGENMVSNNLLKTYSILKNIKKIACGGHHNLILFNNNLLIGKILKKQLKKLN